MMLDCLLRQFVHTLRFSSEVKSFVVELTTDSWREESAPAGQRATLINSVSVAVTLRTGFCSVLLFTLNHEATFHFKPMRRANCEPTETLQSCIVLLLSINNRNLCSSGGLHDGRVSRFSQGDVQHRRCLQLTETG